MTLEDVFDGLTYGELSQMHIGGAEDQGITAENRYRMISHITLGLSNLHKRFLLREKETTIVRVEGTTSYTLDIPDLLRVLRIYDVEGNEMIMDDATCDEAIFMPSFNVLRVSEDVPAGDLKVVYQADHPAIGAQEAVQDPSLVPVLLPRTHLEPLLLFVASRIMNPIGATSMGQSSFHEGNNYAQKYEQACKALEMEGYQVRNSPEKTRFERAGFV